MGVFSLYIFKLSTDLTQSEDKDMVLYSVWGITLIRKVTN